MEKLIQRFNELDGGKHEIIYLAKERDEEANETTADYDYVIFILQKFTKTLLATMSIDPVSNLAYDLKCVGSFYETVRVVNIVEQILNERGEE